MAAQNGIISVIHFSSIWHPCWSNENRLNSHIKSPDSATKKHDQNHSGLGLDRMWARDNRSFFQISALLTRILRNHCVESAPTHNPNLFECSRTCPIHFSFFYLVKWSGVKELLRVCSHPWRGCRKNFDFDTSIKQLFQIFAEWYFERRSLKSYIVL